MWNEISNENDLTRFMETHDAFHDSCIKELKYVSGAYVNDDLSMYPVNDKRVLRVIIQRQSEKHSVIEMEFSGLNYLKLSPNDENYTCEILDSTLILKDDCVIWCDCGGLTEAGINDYDGTVICASKLRWRTADEFIGSKEVY
ncbi:MAG: hypothetical protein J5441_05005 [Clostridia bacterium]|nr:hypothetical protein [Clostridia bacterium]